MSSSVSRKLGDTSGARADALAEVRKMISKNHTIVDSQKLRELQAKYNNNEVVDLIIEILAERVEAIREKATKFAEVILRKTEAGTPLHSLLSKARKYREKLELSDEEFEFFRTILYDKLQKRTRNEIQEEQGYAVRNTTMSRALGSMNVQQVHHDTMRVESADMPHLNEIIQSYNVSQPLHRQIVVQSMMYRNFAYEAMVGEYDSAKNNAACHISPILAAMFLPKFQLFEDTFLLANIAYIIKCRYEKKPLLTGPDLILLAYIVSDPHDIVCNPESPFKDLKQRVQLQHSIWQSVLALRQGQYYNCVNTQFTSAVDACKITNQEAPDVMYLGDEATVMRRVMQAFGLRPTAVVTNPILGIGIQVDQTEFPQLKNRVTHVPMITVRLPLNNNDVDTPSLMGSLDAPQYFVENGILVPKVQQIIYTRDVLIFHVNRRRMAPESSVVNPMHWRTVMPTITAYERVNNIEVDVPAVVPISESAIYQGLGNDHVVLRSIVAVNVNPQLPDLIIGSSALLVKYDDNYGGESYFKYDPHLASVNFRDPNDSDNRAVKVTPIQRLAADNDNFGVSFRKLACRYGTLYIYGKREEEKFERITDYKPTI